MVETIEIVCVGCDRYDELDKAVAYLTSEQSDFVFRLPTAANRGALRGYDLDEYDHEGSIERLSYYWKTFLNSQPVAIIGVVDSPIKGNWFGFHAREESTPPMRLSLVTLSGFDRYSPSELSYLSFFLVKFAIQGLDGNFKAHCKPKKCFFDRRINKKDLQPLLDEPKLCDACIKKLQPSLDRGINFSEIVKLWNAIKKATQAARISVLIMKGGGVKGLALAGALSVLMRTQYARFYAPTTFVGTSAGAIVATLLAAGFTSGELETELRQDFSTFLDPWCRGLLNLVREGGIHSGEPIVRWIHRLLVAKFPTTRVPGDPVRLSEVQAAGRRLLVYAANRVGTVTFDSDTPGSDDVTTAVRASMSLPFFFTTVFHGNRETYDGGLLNNYPVDVFLRENPKFDGEFLALYLSDGNVRQSRLKIRRLVSMLLARDDILTVRKFAANTIVIDVSPIGTTDFRLSAEEKALLVNRGRCAALSKVIENGWDDDRATVQERDNLMAKLQADAQAVSKVRGRAAWKRRAKRFLVLAAIGVSAYGLWCLGSGWAIGALLACGFAWCLRRPPDVPPL